ncbi:hypothetical protein AMTR_s00002p00266850 [Amborella trichopoda]|uniref:Uncharacterized protein n=1 Tax=Amborella trichopoda TaxID=13333 RepID=W1NUX9_AMBTC|nr:hypothetical protein AMTR_s00002p00266850 [Amborella trichopoda]
MAPHAPHDPTLTHVTHRHHHRTIPIKGHGPMAMQLMSLAITPRAHGITSHSPLAHVDIITISTSSHGHALWHHHHHGRIGEAAG